jgi:hypothetical protein
MQNASALPLRHITHKARFGVMLTLAAFGSLAALPVQSQTYDANADYNTNLVTGTNPNGVWTYGWSTNPTSVLTPYTRHHVVNAGPTANAWDDPSHIVGNVPLVYKNTGPDYPDDGNISIPANALILHGGGPNGSGGFENDFSHVVFTAPSDGNYALTSTFQLRQHNVPPASVNVLSNGTLLFNDTLSSFLQSSSYSNTFHLNAGYTLDFAVGFASPPTALSGNSVKLSSTITAVATPEPGTIALLLSAMTPALALLRRRRLASNHTSSV